jgi:hypothetical protein
MTVLNYGYCQPTDEAEEETILYSAWLQPYLRTLPAENNASHTAWRNREAEIQLIQYSSGETWPVSAQCLLIGIPVKR